MYEPFLIWQKNTLKEFHSPDTLRHQFYHPQNWHPLFWWFCLAQIHICLNLHLVIRGKSKDFLFPLFVHQRKNQARVIFHNVRFHNVFLPDDLWKQLCNPSLVCQGVSVLNAFTCSTSLKKRLSVTILFRRSPFTPKLLIESTSPSPCPETP